jgi:hypothetical protein
MKNERSSWIDGLFNELREGYDIDVHEQSMTVGSVLQYHKDGFTPEAAARKIARELAYKNQEMLYNHRIIKEGNKIIKIETDVGKNIKLF